MSLLRRWKGKERALERRDEGPGGTGGILLSLDLVGSGLYDVVYTLPVRFGSRDQQFSLQVDTGSSDLWVAATSCSTQSCSQTSGRLYNPSGSTSTGVDFRIPYLQGSAAGPVVWDRVSVGGYVIEHQAFAAANNVQDEPLAPNFSGILGLALPLNSIIATSIPPVTTNDPDGAAWASNLFSITPTDQAPAARFLSLSLSRPGSDKIPSLLGIGRHPSALVPDPRKVLYSSVVAERTGILFWKVTVRGITVYVNGTGHHVTLGRSVSGGVFPTAVLDSGVPLILTTPAIANAIYGAIGVNPASDGRFYVPCKTPLNLTMNIDNRPEIPLHPLDLTADPPDDNTAEFCIGLIQSTNELVHPESTIGDMILGVPFLRNVYTVMAYTAPYGNGSFPDQATNSSSAPITPRLGLMSLTDPTQAMNEFNTVRLLNRPISGPSPNVTGSRDTVNIGGTRLSMGIMVLLGLVGFVVLCGLLFLLRFLVQYFRARSAHKGREQPGDLDEKAAYALVRGGSITGGAVALSEDELRASRYAYQRNEMALTRSTMSSDRTRVTSLSFGKTHVNDLKREFGIVPMSGDDTDVWTPETGLDWGNDTVVGGRRQGKRDSDPIIPHCDVDSIPPSSPPRTTFPHHRDDSDPVSLQQRHHRQQQSVDVPLLSALHDAQPLQTDGSVANETSLLTGHVSHDDDDSSPRVPPPLPSDDYYHSKVDEFGELGVTADTTSMAGVGTASQTKKLDMEIPFIMAI